MSAFITSVDYDTAIHAEILDAITRSDPAVIEMAEDTAIEEMKGYMAQRYDVAVVFAKTGTARNKLVVMIAIDIALYHLHCAHNPMRFPEIRKDRYKRAIEWLKQVQSGDIIPDGLEQKTDADGAIGGAKAMGWFSQQKRVNSW